MVGAVPATYLPVASAIMYLLLWSIGRMAVRAQLFPFEFLVE
jgi:hypothetical protein